MPCATSASTSLEVLASHRDALVEQIAHWNDKLDWIEKGLYRTFRYAEAGGQAHEASLFEASRLQADIARMTEILAAIDELAATSRG